MPKISNGARIIFRTTLRTWKPTVGLMIPVAGNTDGGDRFLAEMSHPIEVSQQVERLHQHADGKEGRHLQQVFGDGTPGEIFHIRGGILALLQCIHERASLWMQSSRD